MGRLVGAGATPAADAPKAWPAPHWHIMTARSILIAPAGRGPADDGQVNAAAAAK